MDQTLYKKKLEYGVASVVGLIGVFFVYQATTIRASNEAIGPQSMPMALGHWAYPVAWGRLACPGEHFAARLATLRRAMAFLIAICNGLHSLSDVALCS